MLYVFKEKAVVGKLGYLGEEAKLPPPPEYANEADVISYSPVQKTFEKIEI